MMMQEVLRDTLVEIDLKKLANNMRLIRQLVGPDTAITAVVKANAYGHGAVGVAETLMESGADYLAVATLSEAVEIKKAYPAYPVFIMGHTPDKYLSHIVDFDITATIFSLRQAELLNELAEKAGKKVKVHIRPCRRSAQSLRCRASKRRDFFHIWRWSMTKKMTNSIICSRKLPIS